ncbi:MAG: hypothetical protein OEY34_06245 [Cyclobacteriaceae bacterium]|nr:hypothetical protein [Cyclobacteriaceae bacterium]
MGKGMKLIDVLIFSLATVIFLIGLHQAMTFGFAASYWLFMISIGLLLFYKMRKEKFKEQKSKKS